MNESQRETERPLEHIKESQMEQIEEQAKKEMMKKLAEHPNFTSELKIESPKPTPPALKMREEILPPSKIAIKPSPLHEYGVFAIEDIAKGTTVEEGVFTNTFYRALDMVHQSFRGMFYLLPCQCEECKWRGNYFIASTGYLQLYNCAETEEDAHVSLTWFIHERTVTIEAIKDIKKGEEILIWYGKEGSTFATSVEKHNRNVRNDMPS